MDDLELFNLELGNRVAWDLIVSEIRIRLDRLEAALGR